MKGNTHLIGGAAAGAIYLAVHGTPVGSMGEELSFIASTLAGSLLPDLCHPKSLLGQKTKFLSKTISKTFGHRTITHSWIFLISVMYIMHFWHWPYKNQVSLGLLIGAASHCLLDALTVRGIQFLYPFKIRVRFFLYVKTGSNAEQVIACILGLIVFLLWVKRYILE